MGSLSRTAEITCGIKPGVERVAIAGNMSFRRAIIWS